MQETKQNEDIEKIESVLVELDDKEKIDEIIKEIIQDKIIYYLLEQKETNNEKLIIKKEIEAISIYSKKTSKVYYILVNNNLEKFKEIFESTEIVKCGYELKEDIILLKQIGIEAKNMNFDIKIAAYILNSVTNQYSMKTLADTYLNINIDDYLVSNKENENQMSLFEETKKQINKLETTKTLMIYRLKKILEEKLKENEGLELFEKIEMPLVPVLASMEYEGVYIDKTELIEFGKKLQERIKFNNKRNI